MSHINVQEFIARYNHAEHAAKADAYFDKAASNMYFWRKPLDSGPAAATHLLKLAQLLTYLDLYKGARLLDFGVGTCWTSRMFAYMHCDVTALDVSRQALRLGEQIIDADPLRKDLKVRFLVYDGQRIPVDDNSMDRIVCFDSFHHVPDQRATLAEFHRVLRPGGIAGFSEPGPRHSTFPATQAEMQNYCVIENDIDIHAIWKHAQEIGFSEMHVSHMTAPHLMAPGDFDPLISGNSDAEAAKRLIDRDAIYHENARVFYLCKPGGPHGPADSRSPQGLAHKLKVSIEENGVVISGRLRIQNTGTANWLPDANRTSEVGAVNVGVHLVGPSGELIDNDFARIHLGPSGIPAGEEREVDFSIPHPRREGKLVFDAVAEGVAWFGSLGSRPEEHEVPE